MAQPQKPVTVGTRFSNLVVLAWKRVNGVSYCDCVCDCGNFRTVQSPNLKNKSTRSCGCMKNIKHGHAAKRQTSPEYRSWLAMLRRCTNPCCRDYKYYGGRGIVVCDRWKQFDSF